MENFTANYVATQGRLINPDGLIIIPVVVHVLHRGEAVGQGLNLSLTRIQGQIDLLNKDFRRLNADRNNTPAAFQSRAADFNIEFRLACVDPNGNLTDGVVRKQTSKVNFLHSVRTGIDESPNEEQIGIKVNGSGDAAWSTDKYLNIWTCNLSNVLGYSTWPSDYSTYPQFDGIVVNASAFNSTINNYVGRTLTHEAGHWLNLRHLDGDEYCGNDFCNDTPAEERASANSMTSGGCPTFPLLFTRCNTADPSVMFMNFMEFVKDDCMNLFTNDQKRRTRAVFASNAPNARTVQLNGFFGFTGQPTSFNCNGSIRVSPMCLPVTWTVSGPTAITGGQGTSQISFSATGSGIVHLLIRA